MLFKVSLGKEIHVLNFKPHQKYADLVHFLQSAFKRLPSVFHLEYVDEDGDRIHLLGDEDLGNLMAMDVHKIYITIHADQQEIDESKGSLSEIASLHGEKIQSKPQKKEEKRVIQQIVAIQIHEGIKCDECEVLPMKGIRYKCAICDDFDICSKCQETSNHPHALIKIKNPQQLFQKQAINPIIAIFDSVGNGMKSKAVEVKKFTWDVSKKLIQAAKKSLAENPKKEEQKEEKLEKKSEELYNLPEKRVKKEVAFSNADKLVSSASYLSDILSLDFSNCYTFCLRNPGLSKQQLLSKFLNNERRSRD